MTTPTIEAPTATDLALIGSALLNMVSTCVQLGHASPASTLDYVTSIHNADGSDSAAPLIVRDFVAWCSNRLDMSPGAEERLERFVRGTGWLAGMATNSLDGIFGDLDFGSAS